MTLCYLETSLKLIKPKKIQYMDMRKLNIEFSKLLDSKHITYKQHKSCYITKYANICLMKKKSPICYMDYLLLKSNSYYYIFYDGCHKYKPQWVFLNQQNILNIHSDFILPDNTKDNLIIDYSHRIDITSYLKPNKYLLC